MKKIEILAVMALLMMFGCSKDDTDDTIVQYKITTAVTPALSGSVSPSSGTFDKDTEISLTATPASEYIFKNWANGAVGTENPLSLKMNSDKNIIAIFEKKTYSLNIVIKGKGAVNEEIIQSNIAGYQASETIIKLTAIPSADWFFVGWSGDYDGTENPVKLTINKPTNLTAIFAEPKTYVPDNNFEQDLIDLGYDDVLDDYVNTSIIDKITWLEIPSKTIISDLTGIEDFISLETLVCQQNGLMSLDVSKNTKLKWLDCSYNQLTSLVVSNLIDLTDLICYQNLLTSIDISDNTKLLTLLCSNNQLTSLDISNNAMLGSLPGCSIFECINNQLDCIQISAQQLIGIDPLIYVWVKDDSAYYSLDCNY